MTTLNDTDKAAAAIAALEAKKTGQIHTPISFANSGASQSLDKLAAALSKAQALFQPAAKNKTNPHLKSKYADLVSVTEAVKKPLSDNGLSYVQLMEGDKADITCITTLMHTSGQWIASRLTMHSKDTTPQAMGSAITYARRYGLSAMLGIVTDEEDDGEASQPKEAKNAATSDYKRISVSEPKPTGNVSKNSTQKAAEPAVTSADAKAEAAPSVAPAAPSEHEKFVDRAEKIFKGSKAVDSPSSDDTKNMLWDMAREVWPEDTKSCLNGSLKNAGKKPVEFKTLTDAQAKMVHDHLRELLDNDGSGAPY